MDLHGLAGAEIFNSISGYPFNPGRDEAAYYWDIWGKNGKLVGAFASDDSHHYTGEQTKAFTMVNVEIPPERHAVSAIGGIGFPMGTARLSA